MPSPNPAVLSAFGLSGDPVLLQGGEGRTWKLRGAVLKPLDMTQEELSWQAGVLDAIRCNGFRTARPLRAKSGAWVVEGWSCWEVVEGRHEQRRWQDIISAGEAFHAALRDVPRPDFLDRRDTPYAISDRVAWGELPLNDFADVKHVARLASYLKPIEARSQLIHGDLTGNVLFAEGLAPAVIDFSPYWRPPTFASAIVVVDALTWEGADAELLDVVEHTADFAQFLLRALIYRTVTDRLFRMHEPPRNDDEDPYLPTVELACSLVG